MDELSVQLNVKLVHPEEAGCGVHCGNAIVVGVNWPFVTDRNRAASCGRCRNAGVVSCTLLMSEDELGCFILFSLLEFETK